MLQSLKLLISVSLITLTTSTVIAAEADSCQDQVCGDLDELISLMAGVFHNEQQMNAQGDSTLSPEDREKLSLLHHYRLRIASPGLPGHWMYAQINKDHAAEAYRQNVFEFYIDEGVIKSRTWRFKQPGMKEQGTPSPEFLEKLSPEQLTQGLPDTCSMTWRRRGGQFEGSIDYRQCVIESRYKDEKRQLFAEELVFGEGMWAREGAYRLNGELAFGLEENKFFKYLRSQEFER